MSYDIMCAINPVHKKRFILDVYTSDKCVTKKQFEATTIFLALNMEMKLNEDTRLRWHIKETDQEAD